ncbi:MAG: hypothetical protein LLG04_05265 [Parachlamydia sp.]|nr:hypothetical protein [Parachlamydia sp.]
MKDTPHHLKHVQKKVLQTARKESRVRWSNNTKNHDNVNYLALPANSKTVTKKF